LNDLKLAKVVLLVKKVIAKITEESRQLGEEQKQKVKSVSRLQYWKPFTFQNSKNKTI